MTRCGKGGIPGCIYFMTDGCISPFNCMYKEDETTINSATSTFDTGVQKYFPGLVQKYFQGLVRRGIIPQEPMDYDAATLKMYIGYLEFENAELRARLEKAVELPFENLDKVFILAGKDIKAKQFIPDRIVEGTIVGFGYDIYEWVDGNCKFNYHVLVGENSYIFALEQFNRTLFKTREAAEARLKELIGDNNG